MTTVTDIHPHVISRDTTRFPLAPVGGKQSSWSAAHPTSHEDLVAAMDSAGVARAVVVQASTAYGHDNSYLAEAVARHPDRLTGVFSVDVLAPDAVEKIRYWRGKGLVGMRLFTTGTTTPDQADWLDAAASHPAWTYAEETGLPICVQMRPEGIVRLRRLLERFPGAKVILDHLARTPVDDGPPYAAGADLWDLTAFPGVHLKLTIRNIDWAASGKSTHAAFMDKLRTTFGFERIAWGSNFPAAERPLTELVARAREAFVTLSDDERRQVFSGTAERLYPMLRQMGSKAA
ncbi:amidohydrolase family protein [Chelativorans salis]|uniref:Amidohydrolase n=1 Tax=Chelativorans salis TaxID=2978478 RepID=A0ABT2LUD1_9HYPH|nr:amidohydrolase family protein [Chelativorans sp. EGI FJ00035]MCT7378146.1 amidohydrolase [Chelativorans sp. EGI FJ00035]